MKKLLKIGGILIILFAIWSLGTGGFTLANILRAIFMSAVATFFIVLSK